jgi:hypothetical protein
LIVVPAPLLDGSSRDQRAFQPEFCPTGPFRTISVVSASHDGADFSDDITSNASKLASATPNVTFQVVCSNTAPAKVFIAHQTAERSLDDVRPDPPERCHASTAPAQTKKAQEKGFFI